MRVEWAAAMLAHLGKHPLRSLLVLLAMRHSFPGRARRQVAISAAQMQRAVSECRKLVPPPPAARLGGERITTDTYCRFLSVCQWDPERAARLLEKDLAWREKYRPRAIRPTDLPTACSQRGWMVLTTHLGGAPDETADPASGGTTAPGGSSSASASARRLARFWRRAGGGDRRLSLHPPHHRPPLMQWRCTRSGMPITLFCANEWHPERCSHTERIRHVAYHMEHYIRRMPTRGHGSLRVQRACIILDMTGFRPTTIPQIKECIDVLRNRTLRAGGACGPRVRAARAGCACGLHMRAAHAGCTFGLHIRADEHAG